MFSSSTSHTNLNRSRKETGSFRLYDKRRRRRSSSLDKERGIFLFKTIALSTSINKFLILGHSTIKAAAGSSSGSFDNYRKHFRAQGNIAAGTIDIYQINVTDIEAFFATTLIINNEDGADLDLFIWSPGVQPIQNGELRLDLAKYGSTGFLPQENISFKPSVKGTYSIGVIAYSTATYAIDWAGQISP